MTRTLVPLFAVFALACSGDQDAAPTPAEPAPPATEAAPEAAPDRTETEAADAEAVKEGELPTFEGDHAMAKNEAVKASQEWLALVDAADYGGGWDNAAALLQDAAPKDQFTQQVDAARKPLGAVKTRSFAAAEYTKALPGAPDGEYVVIQYKTVFENKAEAVETITPMVDWDGMWKVSGYYVK